MEVANINHNLSLQIISNLYHPSENSGISLLEFTSH